MVLWKTNSQQEVHIFSEIEAKYCYNSICTRCRDVPTHTTIFHLSLIKLIINHSRYSMVITAKYTGINI